QPSPDYTPASPDYTPASLDYTPNTPPLPTHDKPFTETTPCTQSSPAPSGALRRLVMFLHPVRLSLFVDLIDTIPMLVDNSSSDHFTSDNSSRDPISDSSSEGSSDFHSVASPDSFSRHLIG
ncbi:hypothetical protein Tco_0372752, partial [Tanacetum coccineum]